jgi:pyruvate kinase
MKALLDAGVDVFRLNFAHDTLAVHRETAARLRDLSAAAGRRVGLLVDLPGPKMRTGPIAGEEVLLEAGEDFLLVSGEALGDRTQVSTSVPGLPEMVSSGDEIFLADGQIVLQVESVTSEGVKTTIVRGGVLRSRKGMHLPSAERGMEAFGDPEREALNHALDLGADLVGLSFVRDESDVAAARAALPKKGRRPQILAKIETALALENLHDIVTASDAVMVARGDLGIQTALERLPLVQKEVIFACNVAGVPVITATQMLESMTHSRLPSRAEVSDVANAVLDGTDALMLSEETAIGDHPVAAVETMSAIAGKAETRIQERATPELREHHDRVSWAVAHAAVEAAEDLKVAAILCPTRSGATSRRVASFRPSMPIVAMSAYEDVLGSLALVWGVVPVGIAEPERARDTREEVERACGIARQAGLVAEGDLVAVVAGSPGPRAGRTDLLRIARV